jgi:hypothetical protein
MEAGILCGFPSSWPGLLGWSRQLWGPIPPWLWLIFDVQLLNGLLLVFWGGR